MKEIRFLEHVATTDNSSKLEVSAIETIVNIIKVEFSYKGRKVYMYTNNLYHYAKFLFDVFKRASDNKITRKENIMLDDHLSLLIGPGDKHLVDITLVDNKSIIWFSMDRSELLELCNTMSRLQGVAE